MWKALCRFFVALLVAALVVLVMPMVVHAASPPYEIGAWEVAAKMGSMFRFMLAVSAALEKIVTHFQWLVDLLPGESPKDYVLGILGVLLSVAMGIGVFMQLAVLLDFRPANPTMFYWRDLVLTGILVGSGAQVVHSWLEGLGISKKGEAQLLEDVAVAEGQDQPPKGIRRSPWP
jgi:hypothetical protein